MERVLCIIFFICITINTNQAALCHPHQSITDPEIKCNGYANTLNLQDLPDQNIKKLSLSKNNITTINSLSFKKKFSAITDIYLDNNLITKITADAFKNLPHLQKIDLSNNKLEVLDFETFATNKYLIKINLAGNKIKNLNVNVINKLPILTEFLLSENPLDVCNEATAITLQYADKNKINLSFLARCENQTRKGQSAIPTTASSSTDNIDQPTNMNIEENYNIVYLTVILLVMLILFFGLGCIISILCLKLCNKVKEVRTRSRQRTESGRELLPEEQQRFSQISGVDEQGYEIPKVPQNPHHYLQVIQDPNEALLILLDSQTDLREDLRQVEIAIPHRPSTPPLNNPPDTYEPNHVYEKIKDSHFYGRNLKHHLQQPYSCVKVVPSK